MAKGIITQPAEQSSTLIHCLHSSSTSCCTESSLSTNQFSPLRRRHLDRLTRNPHARAGGEVQWQSVPGTLGSIPSTAKKQQQNLHGNSDRIISSYCFKMSTAFPEFKIIEGSAVTTSPQRRGLSPLHREIPLINQVRQRVCGRVPAQDPHSCQVC